MTDPILYLFNGHAFYTLNTPWDHLRAWLWCISNLVVCAAYLAIPREIYFWNLQIPLVSFQWFAFLFISFIALCGISHVMMILVMPTAPWWAILYISIPLAVVSSLTMRALQDSRGLIGEALNATYRSYRGRNDDPR